MKLLRCIGVIAAVVSPSLAYAADPILPHPGQGAQIIAGVGEFGTKAAVMVSGSRIGFSGLAQQSVSVLSLLSFDTKNNNDGSFLGDYPEWRLYVLNPRNIPATVIFPHWTAHYASAPDTNWTEKSFSAETIKSAVQAQTGWDPNTLRIGGLEIVYFNGLPYQNPYTIYVDNIRIGPNFIGP